MSSIIVTEDKMHKYLISPTVEIVVGAEHNAQSFFVHKDLLGARSTFFAKALKRYEDRSQTHNSTQSTAESNGYEWQEGSTGVVRLPEDDPDVFALYVQLVYHGSIPIRQQPVASITTDVAASASQELKRANSLRAAKLEGNILAKLYVFCEKCQDSEGKCATMAAVIESTNEVREDGDCYFLYPDPILTLYNGTMPSDPMREFLVKCAVAYGREHWYEGLEASHHHHEYLYDVMVGLLEYRQPPKENKELNIKDAALYCNKIKASNSKSTKAGSDTTENLGNTMDVD